MRTDYTIETQVGTRMAGGVLEGCEMYEVEYTTYRILKDGQLVGLVYDQADVETAIQTMEKYPNAAQVMNNRFD